MKKLLIAVIVVLISAAAFAGDTEDAAKFATQFYNWVLKAPNQAGTLGVCQRKKQWFDPALLSLWLQAEDHVPIGEGRCLGFDPFTNAQDVISQFTVGKVVPQGDQFIVDVDVFLGKTKSTVQLALKKQNSGFQVANVSSKGWDLQRLLNRCRPSQR